MNSNLDEVKVLFEEYSSQRETQLDEKHFNTLVMFFPSLLVVMCDGVVDDEEWIYVKYLAKFMADTHKDELDAEARAGLNAKYLKELEYLIDNVSEWKEKFILSLKKYLEENVEVKEDVLDTLYMFAEASEGSSPEELATINYLKQALALDE